MRLRELQDWVVIPRLLQVLGVADVAPFGGLVKQFQIEVDPLELENTASRSNGSPTPSAPTIRTPAARSSTTGSRASWFAASA